MSLRLITPPADMPVTLAEVKEYLRVDHDAEDAGISAMIAAATNLLDGRGGFLGRCLEAQTWEMTIDAFPANEIRIPLGPVASITSVAYTNPEGAESTVDPANFEIDIAEVFGGWIVPHAAAPWPTALETINAVRVRFVAGTGAPEGVKAALLAMMATRYDDRAAKLLTPGIVADLAPYRRPVVR